MDEYEDDNQYEEESQQQAGNQKGTGLRRQLEQTLKENRDLKQERDYFRAEQLVAHVASSLEQAGFYGAQAKFVPVDVAQDPARLNGWIQDNQILLSRNQESAASDGEPGSKMSDTQSAGIRRMQALNAGGENATADMDSLHQRMLDPNLSEEDFDNLMQQFR